MSAPTSLGHSTQHNSFQVNKSCATSAQQQQQQQAIDLIIASKFDELARKILDELRANCSSSSSSSRGRGDFFQALDNCIREDHHHQHNHYRSTRSTASATTRGQQQQQQQAAADKRLMRLERDDDQLIKRCEQLAERQRQQQEQLDSHQSILLDQKYRSLPVEITGGGAVKQSQSQSQLAASNKLIESVKVSSINKQQQQRPQRSAIPTSTILSGLTSTAAANNKSQVAKSATTGSFSSAAAARTQSPQSQLSRQSSLRLSHQKNPVATKTQKSEQQQASSSPSEKLKQRRPTKASLLESLATKTNFSESDDDDDDDDEEDDDDDDDFQYDNLASRRAYLNARFIGNTTNQQVSALSKSKTFSGPTQVTRTYLTTTAHAAAAAPVGRSVQPEAEVSDDEPRSIDGLLTAAGQRAGANVYKPHMNYSRTSSSGAHRLSDEDEIIIIPTASSPLGRASPLLLSASQSPVPQQQQLRNSAAAAGAENHLEKNGSAGGGGEGAGSNLDEFAERFSISRTKSFWEKLANSKKSPVGDVVVASSTNNDTNNNKHTQSTVRSAFDRLDSTGGSGNSHYSGCSSNSSTSGDEHYNHLVLQQTSGYATKPRQVNQQQQIGKTAVMAAAARADQLSRADRFRQTR